MLNRHSWSTLRLLHFTAFALSVSVLSQAEAQTLDLERAKCLVGTWEADTQNSKAASFSLQFDGENRVLVNIAKKAMYVPADISLPSLQPLRADSKSGILFISLPNAGNFYLQRLDPDETLVIRTGADMRDHSGKSYAAAETMFKRVDGATTCTTIATTANSANASSHVAASQSKSDNALQDPYAEYSAARALDGFGAVFIAVGEPVLCPINRAEKCKADSGSDVQAGGCAFVGLVISPFLALRDALVGLGDIVTGGYFALSRKSGVFDYFQESRQ